MKLISLNLQILFLFVFSSSQALSQANYPFCVQVNSTVEGHQDSPEIAVNGQGTVLVVFESELQGADENVFAVSYDRHTFREFYRTGPTTDTATLEAFPDDERFLISWEQNGKVHYAIVSASDGYESFFIEPKPVLTGIQSYGKRPDVAISRDGSVFVVGWHSNDIVMQFFNNLGEPIGNIVSVADVVENQQAEISLKFGPDSTLVATWYSEKKGTFESKTRDRDIWFQIFDCKPIWQGGQPIKLLDHQQRANGNLSLEVVWYDQEYPEVDVFDDGRFVIMWQDFPYSDDGDGTDGDDKGAFFRIFNRDGTPQTEDIQICEHTLNFQKDADIRIRQSDKTMHFIYEDAYESTIEKPWLAFPSYRVFDDRGKPRTSSAELSDKSYGTDCRIAITESDDPAPNLVLCVWETKDIENYDGSGRAVIFRNVSANTSVNQFTSFHTLLPEQFRLEQNKPNPFNSQTTIQFTLPKRTHVRIDIFNIRGRKIRSLVDKTMSRGKQSINWDGTDFSGTPIPSGIYFYRIKTREYSSIKAMTLVK